MSVNRIGRSSGGQACKLALDSALCPDSGVESRGVNYFESRFPSCFVFRVAFLNAEEWSQGRWTEGYCNIAIEVRKVSFKFSNQRAPRDRDVGKSVSGSRGSFGLSISLIIEGTSLEKCGCLPVDSPATASGPISRYSEANSRPINRFGIVTERTRVGFRGHLRGILFRCFIRHEYF